jgi:hypothetical protein
MNPDDENKPQQSLPGHWGSIQAAIWLIGLAVLAWQNWWWPGILVLIAVSGLTQAGIRWYISQQEEEKLLVQQKETTAANLPANCPNCGAGIDASIVKWSGPTSANCPYCGTGLKAGIDKNLPSDQPLT